MEQAASALQRAARSLVAKKKRRDAGVLSPFVPTDEQTIAQAAALMHLTCKDTILDLGSGDGRVLIRLAQSTGCRGIGIEIDPVLVGKSAGQSELVRIVHGSILDETLLEQTLREATVVWIYLLPEAIAQLVPLLKAHGLSPSHRIISCAFKLEGLELESQVPCHSCPHLQLYQYKMQ